MTALPAVTVDVCSGVRPLFSGDCLDCVFVRPLCQPGVFSVCAHFLFCVDYLDFLGRSLPALQPVFQHGYRWSAGRCHGYRYLVAAI